MRNLSSEECVYVHGGSFEHNFYESILVGGVFSSIFSIAGCATGIAWFLGSTNNAIPLSAVAYYSNNIAMITLPVSIFAGIGFGGAFGALTGIGLYYAGLMTKPDLL